MKVKVTIKKTETATIEIGDLKPSLVRDVLAKNNGTFDGNWSLYDVTDVRDEVDSVEVVEA
jgi:hypothetical protein